MNLEQLHYIIEVARTNSLSMAAGNLHVTQSAISQSISSLESELGLQLFVRSRAGAVPTKAGLEVVDKAVEVTGKLKEMKELATRMTEQMEAELRIAAVPGVMSSLVRTVSGFKRDYPNVTFQIYEEDTEAIIDGIKRNQLDIGLVGTKKDAGLIGPGMIFEPIWEGKMVVAVWNSSPLAAKKKVKPEEMREYAYVLYNEKYVLEFAEEFGERFGPLSILFTSNNPYAISAALKLELAATIGYDFSFIDRRTLGTDIVKLEIDGLKQEPISLGWIHSETGKDSRVSKMFLERFRYHFQVRTVL